MISTKANGAEVNKTARLMRKTLKQIVNGGYAPAWKLPQETSAVDWEVFKKENPGMERYYDGLAALDEPGNRVAESLRLVEDRIAFLWNELNTYHSIPQDTQTPAEIKDPQPVDGRYEMFNGNMNFFRLMFMQYISDCIAAENIDMTNPDAVRKWLDSGFDPAPWFAVQMSAGLYGNYSRCAQNFDGVFLDPLAAAAMRIGNALDKDEYRIKPQEWYPKMVNPRSAGVPISSEPVTSYSVEGQVMFGWLERITCETPVFAEFERSTTDIVRDDGLREFMNEAVEKGYRIAKPSDKSYEKKDRGEEIVGVRFFPELMTEEARKQLDELDLPETYFLPSSEPSRRWLPSAAKQISEMLASMDNPSGTPDSGRYLLLPDDPELGRSGLLRDLSPNDADDAIRRFNSMPENMRRRGLETLRELIGKVHSPAMVMGHPLSPKCLFFQEANNISLDEKGALHARPLAGSRETYIPAYISPDRSPSDRKRIFWFGESEDEWVKDGRLAHLRKGWHDMRLLCMSPEINPFHDDRKSVRERAKKKYKELFPEECFNYQRDDFLMGSNDRVVISGNVFLAYYNENIYGIHTDKTTGKKYARTYRKIDLDEKLILATEIIKPFCSIQFRINMTDKDGNKHPRYFELFPGDIRKRADVGRFPEDPPEPEFSADRFSPPEPQPLFSEQFFHVGRGREKDPERPAPDER